MPPAREGAPVIVHVHVADGPATSLGQRPAVLDLAGHAKLGTGRVGRDSRVERDGFRHDVTCTPRHVRGCANGTRGRGGLSATRRRGEARVAASTADRPGSGSLGCPLD